MVHLYFDTSTFDQVEKDVKVGSELQNVSKKYPMLSVSGDPGGPVGSDWWHDGTLHWLLYSQWH